VRKSAILPAWGRILRGYRPFLSIEITRACPLRCPGCYAYSPAHLSDGGNLRDLTDLKGDELVEKVLSAVRKFHPLHVSLVGGEPLVRYRELSHLIPQLDRMGIEIQLVTSAFRPIPAEWTGFSNLHVVVSVDGLQPEHDLRRFPATYERILHNIEGHRIVVHCTLTSQTMVRPNYLEEFARFWSALNGVTKIWFSLFTPQAGEYPSERLTDADRRTAVDRIAAVRTHYPKVYAPAAVLQGFRHPPAEPSQCIFAQTTTCLSADLSTPVTPCQVGGRPECTECGCIAGAGLASIGKFRLAGLLKVSDVFAASRWLGDRLHAISAAE